MKRLINFRPISYFALCLCMGILTAYAFLLNKIALGIVSIITLVASTVCLWLFFYGYQTEISVKPKNPVKKKIIFTCIALALAVIGGLNVFLTVNAYKNADLGGKNFKVSAKITEIQPTYNGSVCILSNVSYKGSISGSTHYKITLYVTGGDALDIGDEIVFTARLTDRSVVYEDEFASHYVSENLKYTATVNIDDITVVSRSLTVFERINVFIRDSLEAGLDDKEFAVAYALLCGNSGYMDYEVLTNFRASGVAHIFAVSGLHIGFFAVILNFLANKLRFNKYFKFFFILTVLITYSGVCGFTASSIRATVMTAVMLFAEVIGKKYDGLTSIAAAAIIILIFSPIQLFCVGFQLSFGVVIGINILSRPISRLFKFLPKKLASALGVVLSAQIFGVPISLAAFGEFSLIAILANLVFIPFVGVIYVLILVATLLGGAFGISAIALFAPNYILKLIIMLVTAFDYSIFTVGGFSFFYFNLTFYSVFVCWSDRLNLKLVTRAIACGLSVAVFAAGVAITNVEQRNAVKLVAVGADNACVTVISAKDETVLVLNSVEPYFYTSRLDRALSSVNSSDVDAVFITNDCVAPDVPAITSLLWRKYEIASVYYYGEDDSALKNVLENGFPKTKFYGLGTGESVKFKTFSVNFELDGYCAVVNAKGSSAYLFSRYSEAGAGYLGLAKNPDLIVAVNYEDAIYSAYRPKRLVCYRDSAYPNARSQGNVTIKF